MDLSFIGGLYGLTMAACPFQRPLRSRETVAKPPSQTSLYLTMKWTCSMNRIRTLGGPCQPTGIHQLLQSLYKASLFVAKCFLPQGQIFQQAFSEEGPEHPKALRQSASLFLNKDPSSSAAIRRRLLQATESLKPCDRVLATWPPHCT